MNKLESNIYKAVLPLVIEKGLEVFSVEEVIENGIKIIRVLVDGKDVIDIEDVTSIIEPLQVVVEKEDLIPDEYFLEVSSVGIERPLRNLEELKESIGKYIYVELFEEIASSNNWYGILKDIIDEKIYLEVNQKGRIKKITLPYQQIKFARIAIKF